MFWRKKKLSAPSAQAVTPMPTYRIEIAPDLTYTIKRLRREYLGLTVGVIPTYLPLQAGFATADEAEAHLKSYLSGDRREYDVEGRLAKKAGV